MNSHFFILGDADQVRRRIESLLLSNKLESLKILSSSLTSAIQKLALEAQQRMNAELVFCGGDEVLLLVESPNFSKQMIMYLMDNFFRLTGVTISFGVGESTEEAYLNLARAKASGPASLVLSGEGSGLGESGLSQMEA